MTARAKVQKSCDAPGCTLAVQPGKLMCRAHWYATPRPLREAISAAWKERRIKDWSAACLQARTLHARRERHPAAPPVTPQRAYANTARLLGERE